MRGARWLAVALLLCAGAASAQDQPLDPNAPPSDGVIVLGDSFADPFRSDALSGGGTINAFERALGADCAGFIDSAPDVRLTLLHTLPFLRLLFIADVVNADPSLIVRDPAGRFRCNNNSFGLLNPTLDLSNAPSGDYAIWIGASSPDSRMFGNLYATTDSRILPGSLGVLLPPPAPTPIAPPNVTVTPPALTGLLPERFPTYGTAVLAAGFLPDPYSTVAVGGGGVTAASDDPACVGYVDAAPSFRLDWAGVSTRLRLLFIPADESADSSLIIRAPDGTWTCSQDYAPARFAPMIEYIRPLSGRYDVWIGSEIAPYTPLVGMLYVTERIVTPDNIVPAVTPPIRELLGLDTSAPAAVRFDAAFPSDPYSVEVTGGGDVDMLAVNGDTIRNAVGAACIGTFPAQPSFAAAFTEGSPYLRAFFVGDGDPLLIVQMPDGAFYCSDDSFGTLNPTVTILSAAQPGVVRLWVGSADAGGRPRGRLVLTRGSADPTAPDRPARFVIPALPTPSVGELAFVPTPPTLLLSEAANFGSIALNPGFEPDPHTIEAFAGGTIDASALGGDCRGTISAAPDYRLDWGGGDGLLRLFFIGEDDTTLVLRAPDGRFLCNDDAFGLLTPAVDLGSAPAGTYLIWLGSIVPTSTVPGTLYITERREVSPINPGG